MKKIVIGITGSIAAYKTCELISRLKKKNYNIEVIMTKNAAQFVTPLDRKSTRLNSSHRT